MKRFASSSARSGFSLMEILVAVCILSVFAASLALRTGGRIDEGKVGKVVNLTSTLESACAAHHLDTNSFAYEYSGYAQGHRKLSGKQSSHGWAGPYLDGPLTHQQNPYNGSMHLYKDVTSNGWISGFDVDGDGSEDVTADGNMLWLSNVPASAAESINDSLDAGLDGEWSSSGRVRYKADSKYLFVLIYY